MIVSLFMIADSLHDSPPPLLSLCLHYQSWFILSHFWVLCLKWVLPFLCLVLCFGLTTAPKVFTRVTVPVLVILHQIDI